MTQSIVDNRGIMMVPGPYKVGTRLPRRIRKRLSWPLEHNSSLTVYICTLPMEITEIGTFSRKDYNCIRIKDEVECIVPTQHIEV